MINVAVILSGCGVYDGSEIHETVFSLLAIKQNGGNYQCMAPNIEQHHVLNHMTGDELNEKRNVIVESSRIARGDIKDIKECKMNDYDALVIPGGFGAAKNLSKWAFNGPDGEINDDVKRMINEAIELNKPIAALCMGPTLVAKALEGSGVSSKLTVGTTAESSHHEIEAISAGMESLGVSPSMKTIREVEIDISNKIVSAPCYMMDGDITDVHDNIQLAIKEMFSIL